MFGEIGTSIGQGLSLVAVATGFISYQMKTSKGILFFQILTALVFSAHYFLIGAMTAAALNLVGAIKCVCYFIRNKRGSKGLFIPIFFTVLVCITSLLTWSQWYSIFIMAALVTNSICLALSNPQTIRKLTLLKSPLALIYNICCFSLGGIIYEAASLLSSTISIFKNRKKKEENLTEHKEVNV